MTAAGCASRLSSQNLLPGFYQFVPHRAILLDESAPEGFSGKARTSGALLQDAEMMLRHSPSVFTVIGICRPRAAREMQQPGEVIEEN